MKYPTKQAKKNVAARDLGTDEIVADPAFFNTPAHISTRRKELEAKGYRTTFTDAWGEMGMRYPFPYMVVWRTKAGVE